MTFREHATKPLVLTVAVVGTLGLTGGLAGASALSSAPKTVSVCVNKSGQVVSLTSRNKCPKGATVVKLDVKGATGATGKTGPAGANGMNGANGQNGTNGLNGKDGVDGQQGPGASSAVLDNTTTGLEPSNVAAVTGTDLFFKVDCARNQTADLRLLTAKSTPAFTVRGTVFLDNSADPTSTLTIGAGTPTTGPGDHIVDYSVSAAPGQFSSPLLTVTSEANARISVSANLVLQEGPVGNVGVLNTISWVGTITSTECNVAAEAVPTS